MADTKVGVNILDILWPVGSLYYCLEEAQSPSEILGGSGVQQSSLLHVGATTYACGKRFA